MKRTYLLIVITCGISIFFCGCGGSNWAFKAGYLSDYSKLETVSDSSYRYLDTAALKNYNAFIVNPVEVKFQTHSKASVSQSKGELTEQDVNDLANYFHSAIIDAIKDAGYNIVYKAGPDVARIRVAITDLEKTNIALSAVPTARVATGAGVGGAAMEAEMLDSVSGKQIGAIVETKAGSRVPFTGMSTWGGAKSAMDEWAKRFKQRLEEAKKQ